MVFNPRKETWTEENGALVRQIGWELKRLEAADYVLFYFPATSLAPISLLELGVVLGLGKPVIVCCEQGYYRYTNVHITFTKFTRAKSATSLLLPSYEDLKALCAASQETRAWVF